MIKAGKDPPKKQRNSSSDLFTDDNECEDLQTSENNDNEDDEVMAEEAVKRSLMFADLTMGAKDIQDTKRLTHLIESLPNTWKVIQVGVLFTYALQQ